jgi:hypothetical protein
MYGGNLGAQAPAYDTRNPALRQPQKIGYGPVYAPHATSPQTQLPLSRSDMSQFSQPIHTFGGGGSSSSASPAGGARSGVTYGAAARPRQYLPPTNPSDEQTVTVPADNGTLTVTRNQAGIGWNWKPVGALLQGQFGVAVPSFGVTRAVFVFLHKRTAGVPVPLEHIFRMDPHSAPYSPTVAVTVAPGDDMTVKLSRDGTLFVLDPRAVWQAADQIVVSVRGN